MASRIRFPGAFAVFDAFPDLARLASRPEVDRAPTDHARHLLGSARPQEAIAFLAYLLPRREAVWWARQCVAALLGPAADSDALRAADLWVKGPDEENRQTALQLGASGDPKAAPTWLARAAAWSGGSMCPPDLTPLPAPPTACAQAVNAAIMLAASAGDPLGVMKRIAACADAGIRFAEGEEARVYPPAATPSPALAGMS
jgi:hypothetical protein